MEKSLLNLVFVRPTIMPAHTSNIHCNYHGSNNSWNEFSHTIIGIYIVLMIIYLLLIIREWFIYNKNNNAKIISFFIEHLIYNSYTFLMVMHMLMTIINGCIIVFCLGKIIGGLIF